MEASDEAVDPEKHKHLNSTTSTSPNGVDSPRSPDLLESCQGDAVFTESVPPRHGSWGSGCYRFFGNNFLLSIATVLIVVCLVGNWIVMEVVTKSFLLDMKQGLILREKTSSDWTHPKVHSYISLYMFKVTEPEGERLTVLEHGPYVYRVNVEKVDVTWHTNLTVSYRERYTLLYDLDRSISVEPSHITSLAFTILFQQNDTVGPMLNIYTGESDFNMLYQTYSCNYTEKLSVWGSGIGNKRITGTDGSMFQPCLTDHARLTMFYHQLLRTFELTYASLTTYKDLPVYRYTIPDSAFVSSTSPCSPDNPANHTGAPQGTDGVNCVPPGMYGVSTRTNVYISLPHFLGADPYYRQLVKGLDPQESKHRSIFDVDKVTGKTVRQKRRLQVNLHQFPEEGPAFYQPLYWAELSQEVDDDELRSIQKASGYLNGISSTCLCVGLSLGLFLAAILSILLYKYVKQRNLPNRYRQLHPSPVIQCCKQLKWL